MTEVVCPSCGASNPAENRFCGSCGSSLDLACDACGVMNPPGNRFCGSCGSDLLAGSASAAPPVEAEERKVVSMLFADLTASTEMASRLDPEDLRAVLRPFFDAMTEEIERFGGTVEKYIGDAVVAAFGAPVAHEDDPERSIRCALAMQRRLAELNAEVAERAGADLAMRIGINTGEVISHGLEEGIVTGEAVNIAARFQALAEPGHVVVGDRTYRQTRHAFDFADRGEVVVKGIDRPLHVWRVDAEIAAPGAAATGLDSPFVGRGAETELLRLLFDRAARERRPNLVTIVGPPGIGKSRLSHEVARSLGGEGTRVVRGRCLPYGDGLTYWPLAEILKADARILDSDEPEAILDKARARLDPRFPGEQGIGTTSVLLSSIGFEVSSDPLAGTEPDAARRVIARAWQRYLESMSAEGPMLALIDDIHWADPNLLELIESVVARAVGPMLVVCTARPELFERRPDWGGGMSNATTISLSPLSAGDAASLIEHLLGGHAPAEAVGAILHRSEGNPFFAGELLRMMIDDGTLARRDGRWALVRELPSALPDTVQGVIAARIDMLPPSEKRVIQGAAVVGRVFWPGAVERLGSSEVDAAIDRLIAKGLVWEHDASTIAGQRELTFNHVLTRDVAYASLPRARRPEAHAAIGSWVEEVTRGRDEEFAEILAFHFEMAGDGERDARYSLLAGNRHLRVFAADAAIEWYDRALDAGKGDASIAARTSLARGGALEQTGRFAEALADDEASFERARAAGDTELEARALAAQAHVLWLRDRYDEAQERLTLALERARAVGLADVEARLLYTAGTTRFGRGEFVDALPLHERALEVATASGDLEGQALAHHGLCETYFFVWPIEKGLEHGQIADRLLRELGQRSMVAHNEYMVSWALTFLGRWDEAKAVAEHSIDTSAEIGNPREEAFALQNRAMLLLSRGLLDDAWRDGGRGRELFRDLGLPRGEMVACNVLNEVAAEAGDLERLAENARTARALSDALGSDFQRGLVLAFEGWAALASGDRGAGASLLARSRSTQAGLGVAWPGAIEVRAWEWARDPVGLRSIAERIEGLVLPGSRFWGVWALYARALADLLEGDVEGACEGATTAIGIARPVAERRVEWRSGRVAWRALEALGRVEEARRHREEAAIIVRDFRDHASGRLREAFLARPDVIELLG